jgi:hypothetical protein
LNVGRSDWLDRSGRPNVLSLCVSKARLDSVSSTRKVRRASFLHIEKVRPVGLVGKERPAVCFLHAERAACSIIEEGATSFQFVQGKAQPQSSCGKSDQRQSSSFRRSGVLQDGTSSKTGKCDQKQVNPRSVPYSCEESNCCQIYVNMPNR